MQPFFILWKEVSYWNANTLFTVSCCNGSNTYYHAPYICKAYLYIIQIYVSNVSGMHWDIDITNFPRYDNYEYWRYKNASCNSYNNMFILYRYTPSFKPWILNNACHCLGLTMHFSLHCWLHSFSYAILQFGDNRYNRIDYQSFIILIDTLPLNCFFYT